MQHFTANATVKATERTHNGRSYLVAPVIMVKAGVLNGKLVPGDELSQYVQAWAGRPVTLGHPMLNGEAISAGNPDIFANQTPGVIWNPILDGDSIKAEMWIDIQKAQAIGGEALTAMQRLRAGQMIEVSTGYFADFDDVSGTWNGLAYNGVTRNIRPDHLALLLHEAGACSVKGGCGVPRLNQAQEEAVPVDVLSALEQDGTEMVVSNIQEAQTAASQSFVSETVRNVIRSIQSVLGGTKMQRQELVAALVANEQCQCSKEQLEAMDDATLTAFNLSIQPPEEDPFGTITLVAEPDTGSNALVALATQVEALAQKLDKMSATLTANADQERLNMVADLVTNERCPFDEAELKALSVGHLKKLAATYQTADYGLSAGMIGNRSTGEKFEPLAMPAWNNGKEK